MEYCLNKVDRFKPDFRLLTAIAKVYGKEKLEDLMLFDSLIYNTDRHIRNFGMLVNNDTGEILKPAPIFDNGNSITTLLDENMEIERIFSRYTSKLEIEFDILSKAFVQERHRKGLEKLRDFSFIRHPKFNLSENLLKKAEIFIRKRAELTLRQLDSKN